MKITSTKTVIIILMILAFIGAQAQSPNISSFSPASGVIGSSVTITGTGFSATAAQDIVFFGATQATVTAASTTSLTVTVPLGATYQYISVTNLAVNLTAYSAKPFIVTLAGNIVFAAKVDFTTGNNPYLVSIGDIDGDGKPDLVVTNSGSASVSVFRNTSTSGTVSLAAKVDFTTGTQPISLCIGDIDGDGKPDLATANYGSNTVSVLRNTSTPGSVNFASKVDLTTGSVPYNINIGDIDGDGKPDLAVPNSGSATVSVFLNTSTLGTVSFAAKADFGTSTSPTSVVISDIDGDGKPDMGVTVYSNATISVFRSTSTPGTISFAAKVDFATGLQPAYVSTGDIDGDGKPDLVVANSSIGTNTVSILRNTSTSGTVSFDGKVDVTTDTRPVFVSIGDIDGDGKPDLATANFGGTTVSVLRNTSTSGTVTFAAKVDITTGVNTQSVCIGDIDGDGKPDLAVDFYSSPTASVIRQICPLTTITGTTSFCINLTTQLTGSFTPASINPWVSGNTSVATVSSTGLVSGLTSGTSLITYTNTNNCENSTTVMVTVNPNVTSGTVSGTSPLCIGVTSTYSSSGNTGGTWSSSNTAFATVNSSTGLVTTLSAGTTNIIYTVSSGCGSPVTAFQLLTIQAPTNDYRSKQSGDWSNPSTWETYNGCAWVNASQAPASSDNVITIRNGHTVTVNSSVTTDQTVVEAGGNLTLTSGGILTVHDGTGTDLDVSGTFTFSDGELNGDGLVSINNTSTISWTSGVMDGSGITTIQTGGIFSMNGSNNMSIGGSRILNNYGTWTWTPTAGHPYFATGTPVVNNYGIWNVSGSSFNTIGSGTFTINNKSIGTINNSTGTTVLTSPITFVDDGAINVNSGEFQIDGNATIAGPIAVASSANIRLYGSTFNLNSGHSFSGTGNINFDSGAIINDNSQTDINAGTLNLIGNSILLGSATLNINSGANMFWNSGNMQGSGITNINAGATLSMNGANNMTIGETRVLNNYGTWTWTPTAGHPYFATGTPVVNNYGIWNVSGSSFNTIGSGTFTINNKSIGTINNTTGTTSLTSAIVFTNDGAINVNSGGFQLDCSSSLNGSMFVAGGSNLTFNGAVNFDLNPGSSFSGTGNINLSNAIVNLNTQTDINTNSLFDIGATIQGNSDMNINSPGSMSWVGGVINGNGAININAGATLTMNGSNNMTIAGSRLLNNYGTWTWVPTAGLPYLGTGTPVVNNYGIWNVSGSSFNTIGSGTFTINNKSTGTINNSTGITTLTGAINFANEGAINVNSGTLSLQNTSGAETGTYNILSGATLSSSAGLNYTGPTFTNNGTVTVTGGIFTNSGSGTYKGNGAYTGSLFTNSSTGHVAPGNSPGCLSFGSGYTSSGTVDMEIGGTTPCTLYDQIQVTGTATLSGTLNVTMYAGYVPSITESYTLITATSVIGTFSTTTYPAICGVAWSIVYNATSVVLTATVATNAGTVNGTSPLCIGVTSTYSSNGNTGGSWSSSNTAVATVDASTGVVTTLSAGTTNITYSLCANTALKTLTVNPNATAGTVNGTTPLVIGTTSTYTNATAVLGGGNYAWSSSNTAVATVNSVSGLVTAITPGTTNIVYTITGGCGGTVSSQLLLTVLCTPPSITCAPDVTLYACNASSVLLTLPAVSTLCPINGNALNFDGIDDVAISSLDVSETAYTTEMWFKTTTADCGIFSVTDATGADHDRHIYLSGGNIKVRTWNDETISTTGTNYADGNWHHVAHVLGIGGQKIYVDGTLKASGSKTFSDFTWQNRIKIGYSADAITHPFFTGTIDEVRVWNVVRTQAQIQANMNFELNAQAGLQVVYHFNQGVAGGNNAAITTATDDSGNGVPSLLFAFALTGSTSNWVDGNSFSNITVTNDAPGTFPLGNTTVHWTATDANGSATCNQLVTVNALPPTPVITPAGATSCVNSAVLNTNVYQGYLWSNGSTTASITASLSGNYTVQGIIDGCLSAASAPQSVTINPLTAILPSGSTSICNGGSVTLSGATKRTYKIAAANLIDLVDYCGSSGSYSNGCNNTDGGFSWTDIGSSPPLSIQIKFSVGEESIGGSTHTTTLNGNAGSTFSSPTNYDDCGLQSGLITLNFNTAGYVVGGTNAFMVGNNECWGLTTDATTFGGAYLAEVTVYYSTSSTYVWSTGATTSSINVSTAGTYTVTETDGNGCTGTANQSVTVNPLPTVTVTGTTSICAGSSTTLTASGAATYVWSPAPLPLDNVASSKLAVGLHKLRSTYSGSALQLRRASDNATMDFGFSGNDLNAAAIATWLGGSDGYCTILYDQSGNGNHVTQATAPNQPLYVASGMNGRPILRFNSSQHMYNNTNFTAPFSVVYGAKQTGPTRERVLSSPGNNWLLGWWGGYKQCAHFGNWVADPLLISDNSPYVYSGTGDGSVSSFYENSVLIASNSNGLEGPNGIGLNGGYLGGSEFSDCDFTDVFVFNSVLPDNDRGLVESSIGNYYNIPTSAGANAQVNITPVATTTYTVTGTDALGCSSSASHTVTVNPYANAGTVSGLTVLNIPGTATYSATGTVTGGGTGFWSSSNTAVASVNASSGVITAISAGTSNIIFTVSGGCGTSSAFQMLTVAASDYTLIIRNEKLVTGTQYQFDVFIKANSVAAEANLSRFQASIQMNSAFLNGTASNRCQGDNTVVPGTPLISYVSSAGNDFGSGNWLSFSYARYNGAQSIFSGWLPNHDMVQIVLNAGSAGTQITCNNPVSNIILTEKRIGTFRIDYSNGFNCNVSPDLSFSLLPTASGGNCSISGTPSRLQTSVVLNSLACTPISGTPTPTSQAYFPTVISLSVPANAAICQTQSTSFSVSATSSTSNTICLSYQWQVSTDGGATWASVSNGGVYSGATTSSLSITGATTAMDNYQYQCVVSQLGVSSTSAAGTLTVDPLPTPAITPGGPLTFCSGGSVTLSATGGAYSSYSWSNGATASSITVTATGTFTVTVTNGIGCSATSAVTGVTVNLCFLTINLKMFIQGFYDSHLLMKPVLHNADGPLYPNNYPLTITDFVYVSLVNIVLPHNTLFADWGILNTDGTLSISTIPLSLLGQSVALKINHRNSIETWSSVPVTLGPATFYDFSSDPTSAFEQNMYQIEPNVWTIYNGDIDQNGVIELGDYSYMDYYIPHQINGYVVTDLNGDGATTSEDYGVLDYNAYYAIGVAAPW